MKLQIAFDYLMVFVFVMLLFTILFISLSSQRGTFSNQQSFAQLQIIAQTVASEITAAGTAGNGYNNTFLLPPGLSLLQYNISVTKSGLVIASSNVFGQSIKAVASTSVFGILSNSTYLSQNKNYYMLPTFNGSGFISIQNSFGTVCVDFSCPTIANQPAQLSTYSNAAHGLSLNGYNSYITKDTGAGILGSVQSVSLWFRPTSLTKPGTTQYLLDQGSYQSPTRDWVAIENSRLFAGTGGSTQCQSSITLSAGNWYLVTYTFDGSNLKMYINGSIVSGCTASGGPSTPSSFNIGQSASGASRFNGTIADIQSYNFALTSNQVAQLYAGGITGGLVAPANAVLWLRLNGNVNDYSGGQKSPVQYGPSLYVSVAQIYAKVINNLGKPVASSPIGFSASTGNFSGGQSLFTITGANGTASAILTQGQLNGFATVKANMFNGNVSTAPNLVGWWPLNLGQGQRADGIGPQNNAIYGNMVGGSWAFPNLVTSFGGQGYVQIPNNNNLQLNQLTVSGWVNVNGQGPSHWNWILAKQFSYGVAVCGQNLALCYFDWGTSQEHDSRTQLSTNTWYMVTAVIDGSSNLETVYLNGIPVLSGPVHVSNLANYGIQLGYGNCCNQTLNGSLSNVQVYGSLLNQQQILQLYGEGIGGAPISKSPWNLAAWYPLDGDANDYSGNGNNGTMYGNVQGAIYNIPQQQSSHLISASFSGQNSYITVPSIPNSSSGNITIATWAKFGGATSNSHCQGIFGDWPNPGTGIQMLGYGGSTCSLFYVNTGSVPWPTNSQPNLPAGRWTYLVATYNGKTGNASVYMNGALFASKTVGAKLNVKQSAPYYIGNDAWQSSGAGSFNGSLSNLQVYDSVLSQQQILQLYSQGIGSLPVQNIRLLAWYPLDGDANDYSKYANNGTPNGIVYNQQSQNPPYLTPSLSGSGVYFNGAGSNIIVNNNVPISSKITVSAWVYPTSTSNAGNDRHEIAGESSAYALSLNNYNRMEGDFWVSVGGSWKGPVITPFSLSPNSWYLITGVYNDTSISIYVNGVLANSIAQSGSISNPNLPTVIGSYEQSPYNDYYFNGTISDLQLYNTALAPPQIAQLYDSGAPIYSSTTIPLGLIS